MDVWLYMLFLMVFAVSGVSGSGCKRGPMRPVKSAVKCMEGYFVELFLFTSLIYWIDVDRPRGWVFLFVVCCLLFW